MKRLLSIGKRERPEDLNLNEYLQVNNDDKAETNAEQTLSEASQVSHSSPVYSSAEEKVPEKTWLEKLKGLSIILKIVIALFTIGGIVTPIVVSKTSTHSASLVSSTVPPVNTTSTTITTRTTQKATTTETTTVTTAVCLDFMETWKNKTKEQQDEIEGLRLTNQGLTENLELEQTQREDLEKRFSNGQKAIKECREDEDRLRREIKKEKTAISRANQRLEESLRREREEKENLQKRLSNGLKEIEELKNDRLLMVLSGYRSKTEFLSYVLKPDGSESPRRIVISSSKNGDHYLFASISALIRGKIYIFGEGWNLDYGLRITMISGCEIKELDVKLNNRYYFGSSVVTAADQLSAMICFPEDDEFKKCEEFDGNSVLIKASTKYSHRNSCLALYNDQPVAVSSGLSDDYKKVEKFDGASWTEMEDFPKAIWIHSCIGVYDGYLLLGGHYKENDEYYNSKDVYLLRDSKWTVVGQLNEYHFYSSATRIGNTIYLVSGYKEPFAVEKLEWDGERISSAKVIKNHPSEFPRPIIFPVDEFYCL